MKSKQRLVFAICAAFFGIRLLGLFLSWLDLKYMIPQNTLPGEALRQFLSFGNVQYEIVMLIAAPLCLYGLIRYCGRERRTEQTGSADTSSEKGKPTHTAFTILTHILSFCLFQYFIWTLSDTPSTLTDVLKWVWKPLLVLLLDYAIARALDMPRTGELGRWRRISLFSTFFLCIIVMDLLTAGFMWAHNWRLLYITYILCETALVAEKMIV